MVEELREASFPMALRGYDRAAVDAYVEQVHRVIAEFEVSRSPESAVKHAVAQVTDETRGILERAHEAADEITTRSRARADERVQEAEREAARLRENAESQVRELDSDVEAIWNERHRLIEDVRSIADQLGAFAEAAEARFPSAAADATQALPQDELDAPLDVEADVIQLEPPRESDATRPEEPEPGP
jgi:DivIVA domain-containing protein